ncbi:type VI secretion system OmpA/MotB family protein [Burkholderia sp. Ch1-1]|uniref:type VI secretion system protein TssL, long form n=1 Tax=Paraburkholderia sp. USG1 TaxID=2952268 RepID=UPI0001D22C09|nr:type VI secretion system protein TssL, long form [Paraburkholderia sp. USG1]EIF31098.1 type VI secretion system OmpA/MotB family protein [Burkholderia sp. Ch1-1]MDR8401095.1 type VI secretion system protein TssL, long form [Paraburkholderia sp. USG1]
MNSEAANRSGELDPWSGDQGGISAPVSRAAPGGASTRNAKAAAPAPSPDREIPPGESTAERLAAIRAARNPLLEAARPLLRALADLPVQLKQNETEQLRILLEQEVRMFQKLCDQIGIRRDHMLGARYCLCTALDEAAMQTVWGKGGQTGVEWNTQGLATLFHEDRQGGTKVYLLIGRLMSDSHEHLDLLELIYRILSLGFEGRYRYEADGRRKHETVRQRLYNEIMTRRGSLAVALSPHWQSQVKGKRVSFFDFPVWVTLAVLSVVLIGLFGYFKYELLNRSAEVRKQIADIGRMTPPATRALHLKELLKNEIAAGTVSVDEDAHHSSVTFRGDSMFPPGAAAVKTSMTPLITKIAGEIAKVSGKVSVLGYTDNVPIKSRQFASNAALSEERATQIMQMLQTAGVPAVRLEAVGRGDADPVGDNTTVQGRAQNRRVEITVAQ